MIETIDPATARSLVMHLATLERACGEAHERARVLETLLDAFAAIARTRSPEQAVTRMLRAAFDPLGFSRAYYFAVDRERGAEARLMIDGSPSAEPCCERPILSPESALLAVLRGEAASEIGTAADLCAPIPDVRKWYAMSPLARGGNTFGVLYVDGHRNGQPGGWEATLVRPLATIASAAIANATLFETTQELATRDPLTGLLNRRAFSDRLAREFERVRYGSPLCYLVVDIDDFKSINDRFGHARGDAVLKQLAATLLRASRAQDIVGRFAGDEFVLLMPDAPRAVAESLVARLSAELQRAGLSCSVGAAVAPYDGRDPDSLFMAADRALYATKASGKNGFTFADGTYFGSDVHAESPTIAS